VTASGFTTASIIGTTAGFIGLIVSGVVFTEGKRAKQAIEQQGPNAALLLGPAGAGVQVRF